MKLGIFTGLLLGLLGHSAQAEVLNCVVKESRAGGGWVTEQYYFEYDGTSGTGSAYDAVTEHFEKGPVPAKVEVKKGVKVVFSWNVVTADGSGQTTKMIYRAAYFLADDTVSIRAAPGGYDNAFEARGRCTKEK